MLNIGDDYIRLALATPDCKITHEVGSFVFRRERYRREMEREARQIMKEAMRALDGDEDTRREYYNCCVCGRTRLALTNIGAPRRLCPLCFVEADIMRELDLYPVVNK